MEREIVEEDRNEVVNGSEKDDDAVECNTLRSGKLENTLKRTVNR